jgi:DNA-directed RNA polymerase subunit D
MKKNETMEIIFETSNSLANAIRRSVSQIPVAAIENVEIYKNDSALYDEILAHRLGLIPIKPNKKLEELKHGEKPSNKNQIQLTLKAKGPCTVYASDLKGDIEVIYEKMPIVILDKNQELELRCFVQLGVGSEHVKFLPGLVYYRNLVNIKVKNVEKAKELFEKIKDDIIGLKKELKNGEFYKCKKDADYIFSMSNDKEYVELSESDEIIFFIESWGQLTPKEIFNEAVKSLNKRLDEFLKAVKKQ